MKGLVALIAASTIVVFGVSVPTAEANPPHPTIIGPVAVGYHELVALSGQTPEPQVRVTAFTKSTTARHFHVWRSTRSGGAGEFDFTYRARHGVDYYVVVGRNRSRVGTTLVVPTITGPEVATCGAKVTLSGTSAAPRQRIVIFMKSAHAHHFHSRGSARSDSDATFQFTYRAERTVDYYVAEIGEEQPSRIGTTRNAHCSPTG